MCHPLPQTTGISTQRAYTRIILFVMIFNFLHFHSTTSTKGDVRASRALAALVCEEMVVSLLLSAAACFSNVEATSSPYQYIGPLVCSDASCPSSASSGGRLVNNSNFHLRDIAVTGTADDSGYYYLTGTSNSAGDSFWTDVWGVVRVWRSKTPLLPGSFVGGAVVFNLTRDCKFCGPATATGGCRAPNSCAQCGGRTLVSGGCVPKVDCGGRVWAPELHYLPQKAAEVPGSGGWFISFHFHCAGGGSGLLKSTTGSPFGPFTDLVHGVPGGDVSLFHDPVSNETYTISSGSSLVACRLSRNMSTILSRTTLSPECGGQPPRCQLLLPHPSDQESARGY